MTTETQERIKDIFLDYAQGNFHLEITADNLNEIAYRIETELMKVEDPNAYSYAIHNRLLKTLENKL